MLRVISRVCDSSRSARVADHTANQYAYRGLGGRHPSLSLVEEPVEGGASEREIDARDTEAERGVIGSDLSGRSSLDSPPVDEDSFQRFRRAISEPLRG